jgi:hypothetical protein
MVLKLTSEEVQVVRRALSEAHLQMLRELSRVDGHRNRKAGLELCHRKWSVEALLHQLEHGAGSPALLEVAPPVDREALRSEAA